MRGWNKIIKGTVLALSVTALSACATQYRNHGYVPTDEDLQEVVVGVDTRASVAESENAATTASAVVASMMRLFIVETPCGPSLCLHQSHDPALWRCCLRSGKRLLTILSTILLS